MVKKYKINLANVWTRYPKPTKFVNRSKGSYCIGGALCMYAKQFFHLDIKKKCRFPQTSELCEILQKLNTNLSVHEARTYAREIIMANDSGKFERAKWCVVAAFEK